MFYSLEVLKKWYGSAKSLNACKYKKKLKKGWEKYTEYNRNDYRYCNISTLKVYLRCVIIRIIPYSTKVCRSGCFHIRLLNNYFKKRYVKHFFFFFFLIFRHRLKRDTNSKNNTTIQRVSCTIQLDIKKQSVFWGVPIQIT